MMMMASSRGFGIKTEKSPLALGSGIEGQEGFNIRFEVYVLSKEGKVQAPAFEMNAFHVSFHVFGHTLWYLQHLWYAMFSNYVYLEIIMPYLASSLDTQWGLFTAYLVILEHWRNQWNLPFQNKPAITLAGWSNDTWGTARLAFHCLGKFCELQEIFDGRLLTPRRGFFPTPLFLGVCSKCLQENFFQLLYDAKPCQSIWKERLPKFCLFKSEQGRSILHSIFSPELGINIGSD